MSGPQSIDPFLGNKKASLREVANAYLRSVAGIETGKVYAIDGSSQQPRDRVHGRDVNRDLGRT